MAHKCIQASYKVYNLAYFVNAIIFRHTIDVEPILNSISILEIILSILYPLTKILTYILDNICSFL